MIRALYSAATGMTAQQTNVDNIANNLANANTTGFKMRRAQFQDLLYQTMAQPGTAAAQQTIVPVGLQLGLGTKAASNEIVFTQGNFSQTGNPLDLVIQGNGFFQILLPNGQLAYTRAGSFQFSTHQARRGSFSATQRRASPAINPLPMPRPRWPGRTYRSSSQMPWRPEKVE